MANRRFADFSKRFTLVTLDTRDGAAPMAKQLSLRRNNPYFLLFDFSGNVILKIERAHDLEPAIQLIADAERNFIRLQKELLTYAASYRPSDDALRAEIEELVRNLGNERFSAREEATRRLLEIGQPAYVFLCGHQPTNTETRYRTGSILRLLKPLHEIVERRGPCRRRILAVRDRPPARSSQTRTECPGQRRGRTA